MNEDLSEEQNIELFIEEIGKYQLLYDSKHLHYSDIQKKENLWSKLSLQYNLNAKRRFRSLRDRYVREKKKIDQQLLTSITVDYPTWRYFPYLTFLDKFIRKTKKSQDNIDPYENDINQKKNHQISVNIKVDTIDRSEYNYFDYDTIELEDDINESDFKEKDYTEIKLNLEEINVENKCGQIYLNDGKFIFLCDFCENICTDIHIYMDHILNYHKSNESNFFNDNLKEEIDNKPKLMSFESNEIEKIPKENHINYIELNTTNDPLNVQTLKYEIEFLDDNISNNNNNDRTSCNSGSVISSLDSEYNDDNSYDIRNNKRNICDYEKSPKYMNEDNKYCCTKCDKSYNMYKSLRDHYRIVHIKKETNHNNDNLITSLNNSDEISKKSIVFYEKPPKTVNENNEYPCTKCDKTYAIYKSLRDHFRIVHTSKCEYCFKKFGNLQLLQEHLNDNHSSLIIDNIKPILTDEHSKDDLPIQIYNIKSNSIQLEPKKVKNKDGRYICTLCEDISYVRFENVKKHYRIIHLDVAKSRYFCDQCDKSFHSKFQLRLHKNIHNGIRPYKCHICSADFTHPQYLNFHIRIHLNDKRYPCSYCDKKFIRPYERIYHERSNHTNEKLYQCDDCGQTFIKYSQMKNHKDRKHNPNYVRRLYECDICNKKFTSKESKLKHKLIHEGKRPYSCDICDSKFRSRYDVNVHKKIHSDIKNYVCKICDKRFAQGPGLYSHMKSHGIALSSKKDLNV